MNENRERVERASTIISIAFVVLCIAGTIGYFLMPGRLEWVAQVGQWFQAMLGL